MGEYYFIVNLDKRQYLNSFKFGDGLKLMQVARGRVMTALTLLLVDGENSGGENSLIGHWAGDRIVVAGDYADKMRFIEDPDWEELGKMNKPNLHHWAEKKFEDISERVIEVMR